jgi:sugar lactone lactonase YvrE
VLGESPVWCGTNQCLYWLDIDGRRVHRSQGCEIDSIQLTSIPSALGLVEGQPSWMWLATSDGVRMLDWESLQSCVVAPFPEPPTHRFNDGKIDPHGDLIISTMVTESNAEKRKGAAKLWKISLPRQSGGQVSCQLLIDGATIPNGLDWLTPSAMFWIDTPLQRVDRIDFIDTVIRRSVAFSTADVRTSSGEVVQGEPDGMVRDSEGCLWIAMAVSGDGRCARAVPHTAWM